MLDRLLRRESEGVRVSRRSVSMARSAATKTSMGFNRPAYYSAYHTE